MTDAVNVRAERRFPTLRPSPRRVLRGLFGVVLGIALLVIIYRRVNPGEVVAILEETDVSALILGAICIACSYFIRAALWQRLLSSVHPYRYVPVLRATLIGYLANNLLPARLGDVSRAVWLQRRAGGDAGAVFGALALERAFDFFAVLVLLLAGSTALGLQAAWLRVAGSAIAALIVAIFVGSMIVGHLSKARLPYKTLGVPIVRNIVASDQFKHLRLILNAFSTTLTMRNAARGTGWAFVTWLVTFFGLYFTLRALPEFQSVGPFHVALILAVSSLGLSIPSLPASVGAYQAAFILAASTLGISDAEAVSASILYQGTWILLTSLLGVWALAMEGFRTGFFARGIIEKAVPSSPAVEFSDTVE